MTFPSLHAAPKKVTPSLSRIDESPFADELVMSELFVVDPIGYVHPSPHCAPLRPGVALILRSLHSPTTSLVYEWDWMC